MSTPAALTDALDEIVDYVLTHGCYPAKGIGRYLLSDVLEQRDDCAEIAAQLLTADDAGDRQAILKGRIEAALRADLIGSELVREVAAEIARDQAENEAWERERDRIDAEWVARELA